MPERPTLLLPDGQPFTAGAAEYYDQALQEAVPTDPRIYIRLELFGFETLAMVDTAAPWCILEPSLGDAIRPHVEELPGDRRLSTRMGSFMGRLHRGPVALVADSGEGLEIEVTFFLSPEWPGGNFVGYLGFLDRLRFAIDAQANMFYFGKSA
ncbi:MAG TPA: hypothetical protein VGG06_01775 [Thermoanaerobaculia bacterium]